MIRLRSLGQCSIETPTARLGPEAEILFATALYLAIERGRRIPRPALARLFWPDVSAARGAHCLRQALYKLRSLGVPITATRMHVMLPPGLVDADYAFLFEAQERRSVDGIAERLSGGFLAGYAPTFSESYAEWLEQQRDAVNSAIRRVLVGEILARKAAGDWRTVDLLARRCIALDPLNEEATLALAESAAMHGSKAEALATLDRYLKEIGPEAREIRLPAIALRRRVAEDSSLSGHKALLQSAFVGRKVDLGLLNGALARALQSSGSAHMITGEPGIGKTRLIGEFLRSAQLRRVSAVRVNCQSSDARRPLSAFVDLVPQLLSVPGALGCSPETMGYLRRIERHDSTGASPSDDAREAELLYSNVRRALFDLLDAITTEACLIVALEDVHWLDATSWKLLSDVVPWLATRRGIFVFTGRDGYGGSRHLVSDIQQLNQYRLQPLTREESAELVRGVLTSAGKHLGTDFFDWCVATGSGNPYHLQELALHALHDGQRFSAPDSLRSLISERLNRLPAFSLRVLQACSILGKYSTLERLEAVLDQTRLELLDALDALENLGLIDCEGARVLSRHDLLSSGALALLSTGSLSLLHRHAALALEDETKRSQSASVLWECAEHWQRAGDTQRAIEFLRSCARHSLELGLPLEAAEGLEQARRLVSDGPLEIEIASELATCLHLAGQWNRLHRLIAQVAPSGSKFQCQGPKHDYWELVALEAKLHCGFDQAELLAQLVMCANAGDAAPLHRVHAATAGMMLAENVCDYDSGHALFHAVAQCSNSDEVDEASRARLNLVHHSCFGDHAVAIELARDLLTSEHDAANPAARARALRISAEVFKRTGLTRDALRVAHEAYGLANQHRLPSAALAAATFLRTLYFSIGDIDAARRWYECALELLPHADDPGFATAAVLAGGAEVALAQRRFEDAQEMLTKTELAWGSFAHARARAQMIAIRLELRFAGGCTQVSDDEMKEMYGLYADTHRFTDQDHLVAVMLSALRWRGDGAAAKKLASDYLVKRRDRDAIAQPLQLALGAVTSTVIV